MVSRTATVTIQADADASVWLFGPLASSISSYFSKWTCLFIRVYLNDTRSWAHLHLPASCCVHTATTGRQRGNFSHFFNYLWSRASSCRMHLCIRDWSWTRHLSQTSGMSLRTLAAKRHITSLLLISLIMSMVRRRHISKQQTWHQLEIFKFFQSDAHLHTPSKNSRHYQILLIILRVGWP